jgi:P-type Cu+ transporter
VSVGGATEAQDASPAPELVELSVSGMTCGSCAARVEQRLNGLAGVTATVSYATGRAYVTATGGQTVAGLIGAIEDAGYTAAPAPDAAVEGDGEAGGAGPVTAGPARKPGVRMAVCVPLALAVIALAMVPAAQFPGWQWVSLVLAGPVAVWGAWPLHRAAWRGLGHGTATMDTLVSLGVTASFGWSVYALLFGGAGAVGMRMPFAFGFGPASGQMVYFEAAAGVTAAVLTGRYLEARAKERSGAALTALARLGAKTVTMLRDGAEHRVPTGALEAGDLFVAGPGEKIATDGVVVEGSSAVDTAMITGEPLPADTGPGDKVTGATVNLTGRLVVRATRVGDATLLAQITRLAAEALASKASAQRLADRVAAVFVPCVISLAVATFGFWLGAGLPAASAWSAAIAVLVVACPCSLGLATPAALLAALGRGAELGVLVKNAQALETAGKIRAVLLDKTGTLTTGAMTVHDVTIAPGETEHEVLALAGAVEDASGHPLGRAVAAAAAGRLSGPASAATAGTGILPAVTGLTSLPGAGARGTVAGRCVTVGSTGLAAEAGLAVPGALRQAAEAAAKAGRTAVVAGWDGRARAVFAVGDTVRPGAVAALDRIRRLGLRPAMLTGDNEQAARLVAGELAIPADRVFAETGPAGKAEAVRRLRRDGPVAMVGDGVNDAAALAEADLGMAVSSGTDAAIGAADLTLVRADPGAIPDALELARATLAVMRANLTWAFGYNLAAIPLAALGYLNPLFAGVAMAASSLIVTGNSLRLRRFRPTGMKSRGE